MCAIRGSYAYYVLRFAWEGAEAIGATRPFVPGVAGEPKVWPNLAKFDQIGVRACIKMRNGRVARDLALLQGARRENILYGSLTDEQRSSSGKDRQPGGLFSGGRLAALLLSHRA